MKKEADWKRVKAEAKKVLNDYRIIKPPIDPEALAEAMEVNVVYAKFKEEISNKVSGFIRFDPAPEIVINKDIAANRKTFTIAHELGHYLLHKEYAESPEYQVMPRRNEYTSAKPVEEKEADCFAAELLVPADMLKKYMKIADIFELARIFAVSADVISHRINSLKYND